MYVDEDYYLDTFEGTLIPEEDINKYLTLAQEKIDSITFNRIVYIGFDRLSSFQQDKIQKSICYEAEHIFEDGFNNENDSEVSSYSVLDISVNVKSKDTTEKTQAEKENMCEIAYDLVSKTGLNCKGFRF